MPPKILALICCCAAALACTTTSRKGPRLAAASGDGVFAKELDTPMPAYTPLRLTAEAGADAAARFTGDAGQALAMEGLGPLDNGSLKDFFFLVVWAFQGRGDDNRPRHAHTFATFVRVRGADLRAAPLESFTLSWLPADGKSRLAAGVERGKLHSFEQTAALARKAGYDLRRSPVLQILPDVYRRALARYQTLDKGARAGNISYRAVDNDIGRQRILNSQQGGFTNGIHAVSDLLAGSAGLLETGTKRGYEAGDAVVDYFVKAGAVVDHARTHDAAVGARLGL